MTIESDYKPATRVAKYEAVDELNDLSNFLNETIASPDVRNIVRDKIKSIHKIIREM